MFLCYYVAYDVVTLTFDFLTLRVFLFKVLFMPDPHNTFYYRLLSYELLNLITFPFTGTVIAHAPYHVTCA